MRRRGTWKRWDRGSSPHPRDPGRRSGFPSERRLVGRGCPAGLPAWCRETTSVMGLTQRLNCSPGWKAENSLHRNTQQNTKAPGAKKHAIGMPQGQEQQSRKLAANSREVRSQDGKGGNRKQDRCSPQTTKQEEQIRARSKTTSKARNKAIVQTNFWRG